MSISNTAENNRPTAANSRALTVRYARSTVKSLGPGVPQRGGVPSGGAAALGHQVDQRVTGLGQLCDGHPASLSDELSHGVQLLRSDGDELPSVVDHSCGGDARHVRSREARAASSVPALVTLTCEGALG